MSDATIVVGVDGSPSSELALSWAADEARLRELPLKIVYVVDSPGPLGGFGYLTAELTTFGKDLLETSRARVADRQPSVAVSGAIVTDDAAHGLIRASEHAAMLAVGCRGHVGFHDLLLGSTSLKAAMHAHCPVAVIRPTTPPGELENPSVGRIVLGVDRPDRSAAAVRLGFEEARLRGIGLDAVHAWVGIVPEALGVPDDAVRGRAEEELDQALAPLRARFPDVPVRTLLINRPAAAALAGQSAGAQMLVVGCHARGGFTAMLLGSVAHSMIHHAGCPVLVAHEP